MNKDPKYLNDAVPQKGPNKLIVICCIAAVVLLIAAVALFFVFGGFGAEQEPPVESTVPTTEATEPPTEAPTEATTETTEPETTEPETTVPEETEPVMLEDMAELYEQNQDTIGWIWIDGTKINYPVMYTPDEREKYLHLSFEETYNVGGLPFLDEDCSLDPESDNLIIYGHNMANGTQFQNLMKYASKSYWEEHPVVNFSTLYENRTYDILACFYDRVYFKYEDVFKFYQFVDAEDEEDFNYAIESYKEKALYDTGITAEYGDRLITLVTCAYHVDNGRFVVVARERTEQEPVAQP